MTDPKLSQDQDPAAESPDEEAPATVRCDFCGQEVASVRRVALDEDYDRLRTPHKVRYACEPCSEIKERERLGFQR